MDEITLVILITLFGIVDFLFFVIYMQNRSEYMADLKEDVFYPGWGEPLIYIRELPRIKLKTFKEWYSIGSDNWNLKSMWAQRADSKTCTGVVFYPYIEFAKYRKWKKKLEKKQQQLLETESQRKHLESVLSYVQTDIDKMKKQSEKEIEEARQTIMRFGMTVN